MLIAGTAATPVVGYGPAGTSGTAGIRIHNNQAGWKAVFLGFGIETINNTDGILDQFVDNTLNWFNILTGIGTPSRSAILFLKCFRWIKTIPTLTRKQPFGLMCRR
ncbi:MAG: hypothetical protein R3C26_16370 [Calditrichia bacterium]